MTDWPAAASASFAGIGLIATAWQLKQARSASSDLRRLEIEGVCASWQPKLSPRPAETRPDGRADWTFHFQVSNPGRFPVSSIVLRVHFPSAVQRVRDTDLETPTSDLIMEHAVLPGGNQREWKRKLRLDTRTADHLGEVRATVKFVTSEGKTHTTTWPRSTA